MLYRGLFIWGYHFYLILFTHLITRMYVVCKKFLTAEVCFICCFFLISIKLERKFVMNRLLFMGTAFALLKYTTFTFYIHTILENAKTRSEFFAPAAIRTSNLRVSIQCSWPLGHEGRNSLYQVHSYCILACLIHFLPCYHLPATE
uniref:Uncharacterized protein n=1 Tax=Cacopsylla melanoneura TaxID=428564 RepID=A0A8D8XEH1_9HEMI